ncbi:hypothetical protein GOP47_0026943 [Adiantum capillus-veneris]|nr:hypothetical protein GOP47_0026943 [Adiantum capillus-veneris]
MGLGKTLQAITLISFLKFERNISGPFLVLCPLSVIDGWSTEFVQRAPKLQVLRYIGNKEERALLSKKVCDFINSQSPILWEDPNLPFDVLLTTYDLAMLDVGFLSRFRWRYGIIDEAQRLKNFSTVLYRTLDSSYMMPRRLLLTGTPIQNNLAELWSLLHFCMPKVFNNLEDFLKTFPISAIHGATKEHDADVKLLKTILNVFMLRRTKSALVQNKSLILPSLSEVTIMARLVPLQKDVYLSVLKKELPKLLQNYGGASQISLQNIVVQLRKACSHPYLFDGVEPEPFEEGDHLIKASGKLMVLDSILQSLHIKKHRVLIYAQMTRTLDILQDYLEFRGYVYERLDGSVRAEERFVAARKFNAESIISEDREGFMDTTMPSVFLLTTRAGGVGLNLTAADTVIFYEQDWNPQADKQAVQRAHRIGQTNPVLAINLVTESTVDEVILSRAKKKLKLTNDIMGNSTMEPDDDGFDRAKPSDLQSLIIFGLDKLHSNTTHPLTEDEVMPHMAEVVQQALQQRSKLDSDVGINENYVSDPELEENLYAFEGRDFTPKKRKDVDETDVCELADQTALNSWIQRLDLVSADQKSSGRQGRKRSIGEAVSAEEDHAAKQQKVELKRKAKWDSLGYSSLAVQDSGVVDVDIQTDNDESKVHFVFGDCTKPSVDSNEAAIIFSGVDDSGVWGSGGMFSALTKLSLHVQKAYEAAHAAGDLHVGDLHLISTDAGDDQTQGTQADEGKIRFWVGLAVAQSYDRQRKSPRSDISLPALEACLRKAVSSAAAISASIHMPRISSRPGQDRKEWYAIERLLRKHASRSGVPIYVYYYRRPDKDD